MTKLFRQEKVFSVCEQGIVFLNNKLVGTIHLGRRISPDGNPSLHFKAIDALGLWEISFAKDPQSIIKAINIILSLDYAKDHDFDFIFDGRMIEYPQTFRSYENSVNQLIFEEKASRLLLEEAI